MIKSHTQAGVDVVLVGYERQENLGLRSIMAYLIARGLKVALVPFSPENNAQVLDAVQLLKPRLVGFSIIFQYTVEEFHGLMQHLRTNGVSAHFTAGGHFPSLRPADTLQLLPELDSIVRFEGEETLLELLEHLNSPEEWSNIRGLAFRDGPEIEATELRPLIPDLDSLPMLYRDEPRQTSFGVKMASMLGSRGCLFNCSFCSIRQFYGSSKGNLRRTRSPGAVVNEMRQLYRDRDVRFFSFQDDDFAARSPSQRRWVSEFLQELDRAELSDRIGWKISCRVDDVEGEILKRMTDHGLIAVYLGVESGNDLGLRTLNKHVTREQNLAAINMLKEYDLAIAIGFMLFDPSSTMETIRENIQFLRTIGEDGRIPINFGKMLPLAGTPIEEVLRREGRLKGTISKPNYDFADPLLDWYEFLVHRVFDKRNYSEDGLATRLQQADWDWRMASHLHLMEFEKGFGAALNEIIRTTNMLLVDTLEKILADLTAYGIDFLLKDEKRILDIFSQEWHGEMDAEVKLMELNLRAGKSILK